MMQLNARHALLGALLATTFLAGCTHDVEARKQAVGIADSPAALNQPDVEWKTPFWERWKKPVADLKQQQQQGQAAAHGAPSFVKRDEPLGNVGLIADPAVAGAVPQTLRDEATDHGLLVLPRNMLNGALQHSQGCAQPGSQACLDALAVYPGVRLLVRLQAAADGQIQARVWDTRLDKNFSEIIPADSNGAAALLDSLTQQAAKAAWSAQPFSGGDGQTYINTGRVNGLAEGTLLAVREPGQVVRTPTGQVIARHSGKIVGQAKVSQWVGATLSQVTPVSGTAPGPDYRLTLMPDQ